MAQYDINEVRTFADKLYLKANVIVTFYTILGLLFGIGAVIPAVAALQVFFELDDVLKMVAALMCAVVLCGIGGFLGYTLGDWKSFQIKLQAQTILCLAQIEDNTRMATRLLTVVSAKRPE